MSTRNHLPAAELIAGALAGDRLALARCISHVENETVTSQAILRALFAHTGHAHIIGVTGAPGTGKSTLVNALTQAYRRAGLTVGVVAIDPTSPFTGGAILGDRVRMRSLSGDSGVFIRSMATRGSLGGLSKTTADVVMVLDAAGFDRIIVETVGVGQAEVEIASTAHTTLVIEAPGMGDEVQAIKAGILEIADILVVNKADREGADRTVMALEMMLNMGHAPRRVMHHGQLMSVETPADLVAEADAWQVKVLKTVAAGRDRRARTAGTHRRPPGSPAGHGRNDHPRAHAHGQSVGEHHAGRTQPAHPGPPAHRPPGCHSRAGAQPRNRPLHRGGGSAAGCVNCIECRVSCIQRSIHDTRHSINRTPERSFSMSRALRFDHFGPPAEALQLVDVPQPNPGPGQVRLRLTHRAINPSDLLTVSGHYGRLPTLPAVPGFEAVGRIDALGEGVTGWQIGQRAIPRVAAAPGRRRSSSTLPNCCPWPRGCRTNPPPSSSSTR